MPSRPGDQVLRAGWRLTALLAGGVVVVHLFGVYLLDRRIEIILADQERSIVTWLSSSAAVGVALAALLALLFGAGRAPLLAVIAAGTAALSFDEAAEIHERLGPALGRVLGTSEETGERLQLVALLPVLGPVTLAVAGVAFGAAGRTRRCLLAGLGTLVAAIAIEQALGSATNALEEAGTVWPDVIRTALEEAAEVAGWVLLATGLFALALGALDRGNAGREGGEGSFTSSDRRTADRSSA